MKYRFLAEADHELLEATLYYRRIDRSLGVRFRREVAAAVKRIQQMPEAFPVIQPGVRRALTLTFPYALLYRIEENRIDIVVVVDCRRDPDFWRARLAPR